MPDPNNPGQFGNRDDTKEQARNGAEESSSQFGEENGADPQEAGSKGADAQPRKAKVEGGEESHSND
jgi:hypothetical protein